VGLCGATDGGPMKKS